MVEPALENLTIGDIVASLPGDIFGGLNFLINLAKVAGILVIIYLVFLIIRAILRARAIRDIGDIKKDIGSINHKLGTIIELLQKKKRK